MGSAAQGKGRKMDRDPKNAECTRDPIFLLQVGRRKWTFVENEDNDNDWPFVVIDWNTEHVFLTRDEAETFAKTKSHRWDKWRVYCVPAEGQLARVLNQA